MNDSEKFFSKHIIKLSKEPLVIDVGGAQPFQKHLRQYKRLFTPTKYFTIDVNSTYTPSIVGDAHSLPFKSTLPTLLSVKPS